MKKQSRRKFTAEFKARVALEAVKNQLTLAQLSQKYEVSPVMISRWNGELISRMATVFKGKHEDSGEDNANLDKLYAQIGQLKVENDFQKKVPGNWGSQYLTKTCLKHHTRLSVRKQGELLSVNRGCMYYKPLEEKRENVTMMRLMDAHLINHPGEGVESMVHWLRDKGSLYFV